MKFTMDEGVEMGIRDVGLLREMDVPAIGRRIASILER